MHFILKTPLSHIVHTLPSINFFASISDSLYSTWKDTQPKLSHTWPVLPNQAQHLVLFSFKLSLNLLYILLHLISPLMTQFVYTLRKIKICLHLFGQYVHRNVHTDTFQYAPHLCASFLNSVIMLPHKYLFSLHFVVSLIMVPLKYLFSQKVYTHACQQYTYILGRCFLLFFFELSSSVSKTH